LIYVNKLEDDEMFNKNLKKIVAGVLAIGLMASFAACGQKSTAGTDKKADATTQPQTQSAAIDKIKKAGKLVLGTSADYPPYEFHKSVNGKDEIVGFDIEIAKEIAKDLGVTLEVKDIKFDGLLAALDQGNIDLVLAGMSPSDERKKSVDFSKVYYQSKQSLVIRAADKDKIKSASDMDGKKIGVQKGAIQEDIAKEQFSKATPVPLGKISDLVLALKSNRVDAAIIELPVATQNVNANKDLLVSDIKIPMQDEGVAAAFKKGNTDLADAANKTLDKMIAAKSIDKLVQDANKLADEQ